MTFGIIHAQSSNSTWKERYNKDGLIIYVRYNKPQKIVEFKSVITMNADMDRCFELLNNYHTHPQFLYRVKTVKVVDQKEAHKPCLYYTLDFPFPLADRDMVVQGIIKKDTIAEEIHIEMICQPNRLPTTDKVRIRSADGSWILKRVGHNQTLVENYGISTTKGLPIWLVNLMIYQIPKSSLMKMKALVERNLVDD